MRVFFCILNFQNFAFQLIATQSSAKSAKSARVFILPKSFLFLDKENFMKFLKSLLLCFLFFGLGNFKAQEENNIKSVFISKNILLLESNYRLNSKKINFDIANIKNLR